MALTLKGARVNAGLTQAEASKILGITSVTLGSWEKGRSYPTIDKVFEMAKLYGVGINDLIFLN